MAERLLTFKSGGWVLALSGVMCVLAAVYIAQQVNMTQHPGDGLHPDTYGFDLGNAVIPREQIVASGFCKDGLPAMVEPAMMTMEEAVKAKESEHSTLLKTGDRVIGVVVNGDARAYPLAVISAHEVVNDTVGGLPVVIAYNPLCDCAAVFQRKLGDKVLTFGVSGLLYNSCLLMYDREKEGKGESLWSPIAMKCVAGPSAAVMLHGVPFELVTWADWKGRHPESKVVKPIRMANPEYGRYFSTDELKFPVSPAWDTKVLPNKTPVLAVHVGRAWRVFVIAKVAAMEAGAREALLKSVPGVKLVFNPAGKTLRAEPTGEEKVEVVYAFVFAWNAQRPVEVALEP